MLVQGLRRKVLDAQVDAAARPVVAEEVEPALDGLSGDLAWEKKMGQRSFGDPTGTPGGALTRSCPLMTAEATLEAPMCSLSLTLIFRLEA